MSELRKKYLVRGKGLNKLPNLLSKQGFTLHKVRFIGRAEMELSVSIQQSRDFEAYLTRCGFAPQELPPEGALRLLLMAQARRILVIFALISCIITFVLLQFIWRIEISGAGVYKGEINRWLAEQEIMPGVLRRSVPLKTLCDDLLFRLPRIAWVRAEVQGVTLKINVTEGVPMPDLISPERSGDIIAACDGVIRSIEVYSGTACVSPGDTVLSGQVLIQGAERGKLDSESQTAAAKGKILARTWQSADAAVKTVSYISVPTGNNASSFQLKTPWFSVFPEQSPDYLTQEIETRSIPLGGAWFPLWAEKTTYTEIYLEESPRDIEEAKREAGQLAMRKLLLKCAKNDEIIDKHIIFSMIEEDTVQATATAELIADIGRFSPQIPD